MTIYLILLYLSSPILSKEVFVITTHSNSLSSIPTIDTVLELGEAETRGGVIQCPSVNCHYCPAEVGVVLVDTKEGVAGSIQGRDSVAYLLYDIECGKES